MPEKHPISVIVFDVNETLLDITTLEPLFDRLFGGSNAMREWFSELILYSQTMTLSERYAPFGELAGGVLKMLGKNKGVDVEEQDIAELKSRIGSMPALPDVQPALAKLRDRGFKLVTLTNSAPSPSPTPLEKAGIAELFDQHFSVADVGKFKPHPATYEMVAARLDIETADMCMVACHLWDTIGAQSAGCRGAFVSRPNNNILQVPDVPKPDFTAQDMTELAEMIINANLQSRPQ